MGIPTFVLDVHLGKLARHLRMLGLDALWQDDFTDPQLMEISEREGRVLLTRDRDLHDRTAVERRHYVQATEPGEQLLEVLTRFALLDYAREGRGFLTRCLQCNSPILPVKP